MSLATGQKYFFPVIILLSVLFPGAVSAQYSTAAQYPFVATTTPFQYLVGGTTVTAIQTDDAQQTNIPLGFSFSFCGTAYTTGSVSSNGWFSLGTSNAIGLGVNNDNNFFSQFASNNSLPVFLPFWDDLGGYVTSKATYLTTGTAPNRVFTFEWRDWTWDFSLTQSSITFQLKLYENGSIQYLYKRENGPGAPVASQTSLPANWFGASIGMAQTTNDCQFLNGSTLFSTPTIGPVFKTNIDARPFTNQSYMWLAPCNGAQSASVVAPDAVCPGQTFRIAAVTEPLAIGTNCQWFYSTNGTSWAPISSTNGIITDAITAKRWYKATITCGAASITTQPKLVDIAPHYNCYCASSATSLTNFSSAMDIGGVSLITLNTNDSIIKNFEVQQTNNNNTYSVKAYSDFTAEYTNPPAIMYRDSAYIIYASSINWINATDGAISAYIDFNHNAVFDAYERILFKVAKTGFPLSYAVTDTFTVSDTAKIGITRMRVILKSGTNLPDSCGNYSDGETEDYLIAINYPPCSGPADAGLVTGDTSMCTGYSYTLQDTSYEHLRGNLDKLWQVSADNINWVDIAGSSAKDTLQRIFGIQPLYYRVRMICTRTHDTTYSNILHVNLKPAYKCYCFSQSDGGLAEDSSDIGGFKIYNFAVTDGGTHLDNPRAYHARQDYTDMPPIEFLVDSVYSFYVFHTMPGDNHADAKITMFMDFNNNHKYDIPQERVFTGFTDAAYYTLVSQVVILDSAIVNVPTGLRIILNNDVSPNIPSDEACGTYKSGETEDYMIMFKRPFPSGVSELTSGIEHMQLYPNPSNGRFRVRFYGSEAGGVTLKVMTMAGQSVLYKNYDHKGGWFNEELDMSGQPKGVYFVEIASAGIKTTRKLVIQ